MISASSATAATTPVVHQPVRASERVRLNPSLSGWGVLDGGWWPGSLDLQAELPELIAGLDSRLGTITRVMLSLDVWTSPMRRVTAAGRQIRVGRFHTMDPHMIGLTNTHGARFMLLLVPPGTEPEAARAAMAMTAATERVSRPDAVLSAHDVAA
jgi:hypothetical protein